MNKKKVIIAGGGFGGIEAARNLAKYPDLVEVTLVSKQETFLYYPALYKLANKEITSFSQLQIADMIPKNINFICDEIISINKADQKLSFVKREDLEYDILILGLGSVTEDFGTPGVREHMCQFRTLEDINCLRGLITKHRKENHVEPLIVVGGGPTGVELAASIQEIFIKEARSGDGSHVQVAIIEGSPSVVSQLPEKARQKIKNRLIKMGLDVYVSTKVLSYDGHILKTNTGEFVSSTVVWAAGLAAHPLLKEVGECDKRGHLLVNEYLETQGNDNIFAIGDSASTMRSGLAQTAIHDGAFVARSIVQKLTNKKRNIYNIPQVGYAVPVGRAWGIASFGPTIIFSGFLGSLFRDLIDFRYLLSSVSFKTALSIFRGTHTG